MFSFHYTYLTCRVHSTPPERLSLKPSEVRERPPAGPWLQIGAQLVHAVQRIQEELSDGVDLHQSQIVQLEKEDFNTFKNK